MDNHWIANHKKGLPDKRTLGFEILDGLLGTFMQFVVKESAILQLPKTEPKKKNPSKVFFTSEGFYN